MAYDNRDPAYVPSQQALAADAYIASTSPETHPDEYTYYPGYGNTYTGPMGFYTSGTEYNSWLNSSLFGGSMFGSGQAVADVTNNSASIPDVDVESLMEQFPNAQDTATYIPETNFPSLNGATETSLANDVVLPQPNVDPPITPPPPPPNVDPPLSSTLTSGTDSNNNAPVLTAAGLASALSMLMPQPEPTPLAKTGVMGPSSGGSFNPAPIQTLNYSSPELAPIGSSNKIDYVKQMRAGLFKDLV